MTDPTKPQPPPLASDGPDIADLVIEDIKRRKADGIAKYGVPLRAHNGRDAVVDAYQEALDLAQYLRQEIEERKAGGRTASLEARCRGYLAKIADLEQEIAALDARNRESFSRADARFRERIVLEAKVKELLELLAAIASALGMEGEPEASAIVEAVRSTQDHIADLRVRLAEERAARERAERAAATVRDNVIGAAFERAWLPGPEDGWSEALDHLVRRGDREREAAFVAERNLAASDRLRRDEDVEHSSTVSSLLERARRAEERAEAAERERDEARSKQQALEREVRSESHAHR